MFMTLTSDLLHLLLRSCSRWSPLQDETWRKKISPWCQDHLRLQIRLQNDVTRVHLGVQHLLPQVPSLPWIRHHGSEKTSRDARGKQSNKACDMGRRHRGYWWRFDVIKVISKQSSANQTGCRSPWLLACLEAKISRLPDARGQQGKVQKVYVQQHPDTRSGDTVNGLQPLCW